MGWGFNWRQNLIKSLEINDQKTFKVKESSKRKR
jgi:hypothetical protein